MGKVIRRTKQKGVKDGREWERRVIVIQNERSMPVEIQDFSGSLDLELNSFVAIPLRSPNHPLSPLGHGGGDDF
jgi:hypothetical protein